MKTIIIGCPYKGLKKLEKALDKISSKNDLIFDVEDIAAIDSEKIYIKASDKVINIRDINASYVRYPYDLIPPHVQDYFLRERTEFFKTVAILLSASAINKYGPSHIIRNRIFSLNEAKRTGLKTPQSLAIKDDNKILHKHISTSGNFVTKSLGNCYHSEKLKKSNKFIKEVLSFEEDGGETAYIYPAHKIDNIKKINKYINSFGAIFIQNQISGKEFRVFIVGESIFFYKRSNKDVVNEVDKSGNELKKCKAPIDEKEIKKIFRLAKRLKLNYLCLDAILSIDNDFVIIDVNPFGSFPKGKNNLEVTDELARLMYSYK